jgi:hypothetical protein
VRLKKEVSVLHVQCAITVLSPYTHEDTKGFDFSTFYARSVLHIFALVLIYKMTFSDDNSVAL